MPGADDGATLDDDGAVVVGVVELLGPLLPPPPQPTAATSMAAPPNTAKAVLACDFITLPNLVESSLVPTQPGAGANGTKPGRRESSCV
ncbi:hypothetical protein A5791_08675 [Mycobacterium sp. 852002-51163_SCH5372311]|nr:hypothetical protein A5791_08675 [Mycobacterium sp. 852002-51163_SCH5372311]